MSKEISLICILVAFLVFSYSLGYAEDYIFFIEKGHTIRIDKNLGDWVGLKSLEPNTATVDKGEYIWRDAVGDDVGAGNYTYPTNEKLKKGADIREVRITYDDKKLYIMIKCDRPNDWWVPYRVIGIDTDGATGGTGGGVVLAQGDIDELNSYSGCFGEIKVAEELACEYVVGISSTWHARLWDQDGNLIAAVDGDERKVPGFKIADSNWYAMEISLPYDLIGDPRNKIWRFIIGTGIQDTDVFREVWSEADEWHLGGSQETSNVEDGVDPDVLDLIGASKEKQIEDLNSYDRYGVPGDTSSFCTIKNSYVTVKFGD